MHICGLTSAITLLPHAPGSEVDQFAGTMHEEIRQNSLMRVHNMNFYFFEVVWVA